MGSAVQPPRIKFYKQETISIDKIRPNDWNPNSMDARMFAVLIKNIETEGFIEPVIITKDGMIVNGEHRWRALQQMGEKVISVIRLGIKSTDPRAKLESLALNKIHGDFNEDKLVAVLAELETMEMDLDLTGFDENALDKFLKMSHSPLVEDEDDIPTIDRYKIITKPGDLIILGDHRLLCGDATKKEDVEKLMAGEKAEIAFTSPPYNLGISARIRGSSTVTGKRGSVYSGDQDNNEMRWAALMRDSTALMLENAAYCFINLQLVAGNKKALSRWWTDHIDNFCDVAIWDKGSAQPAMATNVMNSRFELIFILTKDKPSRAIRAGAVFRGTVDNVFNIPGQRSNEQSDIHGATFPIELPRTFIELFSTKKKSVFDPFAGTGTTMLACEQTGRKCFLMEIDPAYCDVTIKRWETLTGKKADRKRKA